MKFKNTFPTLTNHSAPLSGLLRKLVICMGVVAPEVAHADAFAVSATNPFPALQFVTRRLFADFNNDGAVDMLYQNGNTSGQNIALMLNNGNGTFATPINASNTGVFSSGPLSGITFSSIVPFEPTARMFVIDYDNDGDDDVFESSNSSVGRLLVNNNGSFSVAASNPFIALPFAPRRIFADFNNDGAVDLLYQNGNTSGQNISLILNNGNGTFGAPINANTSGQFTSGPFSGITFTSIIPYTSSPGLTALDYDNDGDIDLYESSSGTSGRLLVNGNGAYSTAASNPFPTLPFAVRRVFGDFNADGAVDMLYQSGNTANQDIYVMLNAGNGTFSAPINASSSGTFSSGPFAGITFAAIFGETVSAGLTVLDFDNDGDDDLYEAVNNTSGRLLVQTGGPPYIVSTNPANNATNVSVQPVLNLTFSEVVTKGTGIIRILRSSDSVVAASINVTSAQVSGSGTAWSITLSTPLSTSTQYFVRMDEGTFKDSYGSIFNGISSATAFRFTTSSVGLPVELMRFAATPLSNRTVKLQWQTSSEHQLKGFEVERSGDGSLYETVSFQSSTGSSSTYELLDNPDHTGQLYYRLKSLSLDGTSSYSQVSPVFIAKHETVGVGPNPFGQCLTINVEVSQRVTLFNAFSQPVLQASLERGKNVLSTAHLPAGNYFLIETRTGRNWPLIKQ